MSMRKVKVLAVDDDETNLYLIDAMLKSEKFEVYKLNDGKKVVETAGNRKPDVILLDIMMPGIDGYTTLNELKNNVLTKPIPVIMVTALDFELNKKLAEQLGAEGFITKPIDRQELLTTINNLFPDS